MCFTCFSSVHHFLHYRSEEGLAPSVIDKTIIRETGKFQTLGRVCICVSVGKTGLDCHVGGLSMTVQGSVCASECSSVTWWRDCCLIIYLKEGMRFNMVVWSPMRLCVLCKGTRLLKNYARQGTRLAWANCGNGRRGRIQLDCVVKMSRQSFSYLTSREVRFHST